MANAVSYVRGIIPDAENREKDDFYPTPPRGTKALLDVETFSGRIWEPACGDGAISKVLVDAGHDVVSTDLIDRGYGLGGVDFLMDFQTKTENIITNPPFKHAEDFCRHAINRTTGKVAMLCRLAWLEGKARRSFFENTPLARVWVFSSRLPMQRGRQHDKASDVGGMIAFAWFVWDHQYSGAPSLGWLP